MNFHAQQLNPNPVQPNTACTRSPAAYAGAMVVGVGAFSSWLYGLELVPAKWRCLVPPTSPHQGADATGNASRWLLIGERQN
jgi:hypothetical protein